ncbi:methyltransferase domain-containing protein [Dickeya poaceiphila]|uniref:Class I SAM-dependent methyltransferase n=1 Tax=Dickeya poaceiphila TaxID=568768 RepID=A0A5B8I357_9GAMM|nr:methyltransferase domain-containing protein [Dickeya poaceiphila]QDX29572.1 class I SAM-dependent methyltransferase [Dickeya poaceiphila]
MKKICELINSELSFFPELGIGHYPVPKNRPYDEGYFSKYASMASTEMGRELTKFRINFVKKYHAGDVVDVGIGCGQFVSKCENAKGFDVNPAGVEWLHKNGKFHDIYNEKASALTFWDVLEHIDNPEQAISQATEWVFVSIPIFDNAEHILKSRHFRKDEHIWYFTDVGLRKWFLENGFECVDHCKTETELGRDGIDTYAFRRVANAKQDIITQF